MDYEVIDSFNIYDKKHEVRLYSNGNEITVKVFNGDRPSNGYYYNVTLEVKSDLKVLCGIDAIKELARIAKNDVIEKKWEKLNEAIKLNAT